jgi:hypothetical protein
MPGLAPYGARKPVIVAGGLLQSWGPQAESALFSPGADDHGGRSKRIDLSKHTNLHVNASTGYFCSLRRCSNSATSSLVLQLRCWRTPDITWPNCYCHLPCTPCSSPTTTCSWRRLWGPGSWIWPEENMVLVVHPRMAIEGRLNVTNEAILPCDAPVKWIA